MTPHATYPHPRDRAACARFRMSRRDSKRRERSQAHHQDTDLLERISKLEREVSGQAATTQKLVSMLSNCMCTINGAMTSALSASASTPDLPVPPSHPAPSTEPLSPIAPSSCPTTDAMRSQFVHDVSNVRHALPPESSFTTSRLSPHPAARQDRLERALPGLKGFFKS